ncbi:ABC transporter permease [Streptococcus lutetiensis]|uniref:ABC transporter permease n=1 Tax=Streptococcus lutetiensis TaxID=150055 RepID=UPI001F06FD3C|nr:ABC transporter permease [Streptococcus lutetiensis]
MIEARNLRHNSNLGLYGGKIVAKNELVAFFRSKGILASQLIQPILYVVFVVVGLNDSIHSVNFRGVNVTYAEYTILGIIGLLIIGQMTQVIYRVTIDKKYGLLALKLCSGVKPFFYILGMSVFPILGLLVQEVVIFGIAILFGIQLVVSKYLIVIILSILILLFWNSIGILITMFINDYRRRDIVIRFLLTPLGFSAPVFYIMDSAPEVIRLFGKINPLTYQLEIIRDVYFNNIYFGVIGILLTSVVAIVVAILVIPRINLILIER